MAGHSQQLAENAGGREEKTGKNLDATRRDGQQLLAANGAEPGDFTPGTRHQRIYYLKVMAEGRGLASNLLSLKFNTLYDVFRRWVRWNAASLAKEVFDRMAAPGQGHRDGGGHGGLADAALAHDHAMPHGFHQDDGGRGGIRQGHSGQGRQALSLCRHRSHEQIRLRATGQENRSDIDIGLLNRLEAEFIPAKRNPGYLAWQRRPRWLCSHSQGHSAVHEQCRQQPSIAAKRSRPCRGDHLS